MDSPNGTDPAAGDGNAGGITREEFADLAARIERIERVTDRVGKLLDQALGGAGGGLLAGFLRKSSR